MTSKYGKLKQIEENSLNKLAIVDQMMAGELLFFHRQSLKATEPTADNYYPGHCGLYLGARKIIHATRKDNCVSLSNLDENSYWLSKFVGHKDILADDSAVKTLTLHPDFKNISHPLEKGLK